MFSLIAFAQTENDSITIVKANWKTTVVQDGVVHKHANIQNLYGVTQNINIIEIDTKKKNLKLAIADALPNETTSELAIKNKAIAAINGSYFNVKEGYSVCYLKFGKNLIDTTTVLEMTKRVNGAISERKGKMDIIPWSKQIELNNKSKNKNILASGPLMMYKGQICNFSDREQKFVDTKHPRTAIAITKDKKVLLITVDGRFPNQGEGINIRELAHFIRVIGGKHALNLDGGGSTTMWHQAAPENGVVNSPYDNKKFDNWGERKVANIVYVYSTK